MAWTTSDLLAAIKRRSFAPTGQVTFTDAELLKIADEAMLTVVVPDILAVREEFFVVHKDYAITEDQAAYDIPPRASGLAVREVWVVDGTSVTPNFPRLEPEEITGAGTGTPEGFYLKGNQLVLYPTPAATAKTLRVFFFLRPGTHVATSAAGVISAIDTGTKVVTLAAIPSAWATGNVFDFIRQDGGQEPLAIDQTSTLVSGATITFAALPSDLRVGDYVALAGETPLPFLPPEYRPVLAQAAAAEVLGAMNQPGADSARKQLDALRKTAQRLITPRVLGEPQVITPVNWF